VEPRGFEPLTSAVQRRHNTFLELSGDCKITANTHVLLCDAFPELSGDSLGLLHGCCTYGALDRGIAGSSSDLSAVGDVGHASVRNGRHQRRQARAPKGEVAAKWKLLPIGVTKPFGEPNDTPVTGSLNPRPDLSARRP
jgi:hypothetical protein